MRKFLIIAAVSISLGSCLKLTDPVINDIEESFLSGPGVFIVNEGNFRSGNGSLSFYSYDSVKLFNHAFLSVNHRPLGDVPYSAEIAGTRMYIVVNNSGKIEVVDRDFLRSIATINGLIAPRYISVLDRDKAYVTSLYSDSITILDLSSNTISGYIALKHPSEAVSVYNSKAFVAHWAGGNKVFVINTPDNTVIDSIEVGMEPESMVFDRNGTLWILCNGGWQREHFAELIAVNPQSLEIINRFQFPSINDSPTCLQINRTGETLFYLQNGLRRMNINESALPSSVFIQNSSYNFYKLGINPANDDIFVTDASDYQNKGNVLRYNSNGGLVSLMQADIIPGGICFKNNPDPYIE